MVVFKGGDTFTLGPGNGRYKENRTNQNIGGIMQRQNAAILVSEWKNSIRYKQNEKIIKNIVIRTMTYGT